MHIRSRLSTANRLLYSLHILLYDNNVIFTAWLYVLNVMSYAPMSQVIIELNLYRAYLVPSKTKRFLFIISLKYDTTSYNSNLVF